MKIDNINFNTYNNTISKNNTNALKDIQKQIEVIHNKSAENITEEYIKEISAIGRESNNINSNDDSFKQGAINIIANTEVQNKYGLKIFKPKNSIENLTVGDIATYMYNQNKVSSELRYIDKQLNMGQNKNSDTYKNDPLLFDAINNDETGLAKQIAQLYFRITAQQKDFNEFSSLLDKYKETKLKDLNADTLHNIMIAKETGDIEVFNHIINNIDLKKDEPLNINTLKSSYKNLQQYLKNKPDIIEQQSILDKIRNKIKE